MARIEEEMSRSGGDPNPTDDSLLSNDGRADLHLHTVHSDGACTPYDIVKRAHEAGLSAIAIADHDNLSAIDEAIEWGASLGVRVVPGLELSATMGEKDLHLLAYFIDRTNERLLEDLAFFRQERLRRAERIVQKLNRINVPLRLDSVLEQAGIGSVGRPHIANALVEHGLTDSFHEAFEKYIGAGGPAFEKKFQLTPQEAIRLINSAGGLSFLAHPGRSVREDEILHLISLGLDGIEIIHPAHREEQREYYRGIVNHYFLLESGGSDFHGGRKGDDHTFGAFTVPMRTVDAMKKRLFS
jgi:predicted metal-dependent phosphoesterase TrpH